MCRIGGRLGSVAVRLRGVAGEIPPLLFRVSNPGRESGSGTVSGGKFDWGGRLLKSNGGARWSP
jgi:hypothetical protein